MLLWDNSRYELSQYLNSPKFIQESLAIAKMTARCAIIYTAIYI